MKYLDQSDPDQTSILQDPLIATIRDGKIFLEIGLYVQSTYAIFFHEFSRVIAISYVFLSFVIEYRYGDQINGSFGIFGIHRIDTFESSLPWSACSAQEFVR